MGSDPVWGLTPLFGDAEPSQRRMTVVRTAVLLCAAGLLLAACGGRSAAAHVVRIEATNLARPGGTVVAVADARKDGREAPLASVLPLVPATLSSGGACGRVGVVTITFSNGRVRRYGSCRPPAIDTLQQALTAEAAQWNDTPVRSTRIVGANPAERRVLRSLLASMRPTRIRSVGIETVAHPSKWSLPSSDVRIRVHGGTSMRGIWEGDVLAERYTALAGGRLRLVGLISGSDSTRAGGLERQHIRLSRRRARVLHALAGEARLVELRDEAGGLAVVVRTAHPGAFLKARGRALVAATRTPAHYVGVEDASGAVVYAWAGLPNEGMVYPRPDLDACGPIVHSTPAFYKPLPCRAR